MKIRDLLIVMVNISSRNYIYHSIVCMCLFAWWACANKKLFIWSITLFAKIHLPDSTKWRPSSNRWILEILLLSTKMKLLFLHIKEIFLLTSSKSNSGILLFHTIANTKTFASILSSRQHLIRSLVSYRLVSSSTC